MATAPSPAFTSSIMRPLPWGAAAPVAAVPAAPSVFCLHADNPTAATSAVPSARVFMPRTIHQARRGRACSVHDVVVRGRRLVAAVLQLVRVADHLAQEGRERAELHRLARGREVDGLVHERPHEREIRLAAAPAQLAQDGVEARFVLLLEIVEIRHGDFLARRDGSPSYVKLFTRSSLTSPRPAPTELIARRTATVRTGSSR